VSRGVRTRLLAAVAIVLASAAPAFAVDGVVEINQARAIAGGVTPGDAPGFPVTISQTGSYRLVGNLDVSGVPGPENVTAIEITASFVTLDLNGFSVQGPTVCTGTPVTSCSPLGTGSGIYSPTANFVRISDGRVTGFGNRGIWAGNATVHRVRVSHNGLTGVWLASGGLVTDSASSRNGHDGISGAGLVVRESRASQNGLSGFYLYPGSAEGCQSAENGAFGIHVGAGLATGNVVIDNVGCGIDAPSGAYAGNVVLGPTSLCGGVELAGNLCNGSATCP
jgi:hypothetical protein